MKIRNVGAMNSINDTAHSRSLTDSIMMPQVIIALGDWRNAGVGGVLIGAVALGFHVRPRMAQELEFLFADDAAIPDAVSGFDRLDPRLFRHHQTGVEVNVVTRAAIEVPIAIAEEVARTAIESDGVRVASESGLVALKLFRRSRQSEADIVALIKTGRVDLSGFRAAPEKMSGFRELVEVAATDPHPP
jgi:hypothetical protein